MLDVQIYYKTLTSFKYRLGRTYSFFFLHMSDGSSSTHDPLHVVCVYTLSGQYGQGQRASLYVLIVALCLAGQSEIIANVALGSSLLFGLSAAVHAHLLAFTNGIGGGKYTGFLIRRRLTDDRLLNRH